MRLPWEHALPGLKDLPSIPKSHPQDADREAWPRCWQEPRASPRAAALALRFTLGQPITAAIPPGDAPLFRRPLDVAERFQPLEDAELVRRARGLPPFLELASG